jgi:hypothetical protein
MTDFKRLRDEVHKSDHENIQTFSATIAAHGLDWLFIESFNDCRRRGQGAVGYLQAGPESSSAEHV